MLRPAEVNPVWREPDRSLIIDRYVHLDVRSAMATCATHDLETALAGVADRSCSQMPRPNRAAGSRLGRGLTLTPMPSRSTRLRPRTPPV
jgi:hypothetical protein